MALDHYAEDAVVTVRQLARHILADFYLFLRILARIRVAEIDHETLGETRLGEPFSGRLDARRIIVGRFAAAQDDMAIFVARSRDDRRVPGFRDRQEMMRRCGALWRRLQF